jgi:hypothetical protein
LRPLSAVVVEMIFGARTALCADETENRYLNELVKERIEKEKAQLELAYAREKMAYEARIKELELANLRMHLELERLRNQRADSPCRKRASTSEKVAAVSAFSPYNDQQRRLQPTVWNEAERLDIIQFFRSHRTHSTQATIDYAYQTYHKTLATSTLSGWKLRCP